MGRHEISRRTAWVAALLLGAAGLSIPVGASAAQVEVHLPGVQPVTVPPVSVPPVTVPPLQVPEVKLPPVQLPSVNLPPLPVTVPGLLGGPSPQAPPSGAKPQGPPPGGGAGTVSASAPPAPPAPPAAGAPAPRVEGTSVSRLPGTAAPRAPRPLGRALAETVPFFGLPLTVGGLILIFLIVQGRLDRRDPKLATAPITDEVLQFS
jgi:hypothetical protein